jgi:hypothetical protein
MRLPCVPMRHIGKYLLLIGPVELNTADRGVIPLATHAIRFLWFSASRKRLLPAIYRHPFRHFCFFLVSVLAIVLAISFAFVQRLIFWTFEVFVIISSRSSRSYIRSRMRCASYATLPLPPVAPTNWRCLLCVLRPEHPRTATKQILYEIALLRVLLPKATEKCRASECLMSAWANSGGLFDLPQCGALLTSEISSFGHKAYL